jgi:hypothetical protein
MSLAAIGEMVLDSRYLGTCLERNRNRHISHDRDAYPGSFGCDAPC